MKPRSPILIASLAIVALGLVGIGVYVFLHRSSGTVLLSNNKNKCSKERFAMVKSEMGDKAKKIISCTEYQSTVKKKYIVITVEFGDAKTCVPICSYDKFILTLDPKGRIYSEEIQPG